MIAALVDCLIRSEVSACIDLFASIPDSGREIRNIKPDFHFFSHSGAIWSLCTALENGTDSLPPVPRIWSAAGIMPDSDDEYIQDVSDDEAGAHQVGRVTGPSTRRGAGQGARGTGGWEVTRTWENVVEGEDGTISGTVEGLLEAGKRKR